MKKSSILTKIVLSMVLLALVFSLVACGKKDDTGKGKPPEPQKEATLAEQVVEVIDGVKPLLAVLNDAKAGDTLGADVKLSVDLNIGKINQNHVLAVAANANADSPEAQISYKFKSTEWFNLTYKDDKIFLVQPVTAINTTPDTDSSESNVAALKPAVKDLMAMAMDVIDGINIALPEDLSGKVAELLEELPKSVTSLLKIESTSNGYTLMLGASVMETVADLLPMLAGSAVKKLLGDELGTTVINAVAGFLAEKPELGINIGLDSNKAINAIGIKYKKEEDTADINVGLVLKTSKVSISAPSASKKALNIGAEAEVVQKGAKVTAELFATGDLSKDLQNIAYAEVTANGAKSYGAFNGQTVYFNTNALYEALNSGANKNLITTPKVTDYSVTIQTKGDDKQYAKNSIVNLINKAAATAKSDYMKNKGKEKPAASTSTTTNTVPKKTITHSIYELLGGTLKETVKDKKVNGYEAVSEKDMMTLVDSKIGKYVRDGIIDKTSSSDNYFKTVQNILFIVAHNDDWIAGADYISENGIKSLGGFVEIFTKLDTWFTKQTTTGNVHGIVDWNTSTWSGGLTVTKDGPQNDLLDVVNLFACQNVDGVKKDVDGKFLADFINYYIAALGYYTHQDQFTAEAIAAIDEADATFKTAKETFEAAKKVYNDAKDAFAEAEEAYKNGGDYNTYKTARDTMAAAKKVYDAAKETYNTAKKTHKTTLEAYYNDDNGLADRVLCDLLGIQKTADSTVVEQLISGGLYINVGCKKNEGLNGFIEIRKGIEPSSDSYVKVSLHLNLVADNVASQVEAAVAAGLKNTETGVTELFDPTLAEGTENPAQKQLWDALHEAAKAYMKYEAAAA